MSGSSLIVPGVVATSVINDRLRSISGLVNGTALASVIRTLSSGTRFDLGWTGDSIALGYYGANHYCRGAQNHVQRGLAARYGYAGPGLMTFHQDDLVPATPGTKPITVTDLTITNGGSSYGICDGYAYGSAPGKVEFSAYCDNLDIYLYEDAAGGALTVKVDGVTLGTTYGTSNATTRMVVYNVPLAVAAGMHAIEIDAPAGPATCGIVAVAANVGSAGVRMMNWAKDGSRLSVLVPGSHSMDFLTAKAAPAFTVSRMPHLAVVMSVYNDFHWPTAVATWLSKLSAIVAAHTCPVLIVIPPTPNESQTVPYSAFAAAARGIATGTTACLDLSEVYPTAASWSTLSSDGIHPNDAGHAVIAQKILQCLDVPFIPILPPRPGYYAEPAAANADYTVPEVGYQFDHIAIGGTWDAGHNAVLPTQAGCCWTISNTTGQTVTAKTAAGTGVAIADDATTRVVCDGLNIVAG